MTSGGNSSKRYRPKFQRMEDLLEGTTIRSLDNHYGPEELEEIRTSRRDIFGQVPRHRRKVESELRGSEFNFDKVTRTKTILFSEKELLGLEDEPLDIDSAMLKIGTQRVSQLSNFTDQKRSLANSPGLGKDYVVSDHRGASAFYNDLQSKTFMSSNYEQEERGDYA